MVHHNSSSVPLRSLLFQLTDISSNTISSRSNSDVYTADQHALFIFFEGSGSLQIGAKQYHVGSDKCYMISPGDVFRIQNTDGVPLCYYHLTFTAIQSEASLLETYTNDIIEGYHEFAIPNFSRLLRHVEDLYTHKHHQSDLESFRQHLRFQEFMGLLFEHNLSSGQPYLSASSVEHTIQYLQNHYMQRITVKQLAEMASVPLWQYTPLFHKLTGKKPLDYLNEIRINRSKDWLMRSDEPLRKIAQRVGFEDEFYFNRRFRKTTGITPRQYANKMRQNNRFMDWTGHEVAIPEQPQRIIFHSETFGDLLALGIEAIGGGHSFIAESISRERIQSVKDTGWPIDVNKLRDMQPDLIIFSSADEDDYMKFSKIAPTVTFNSFDSLEQRLRTLGVWLNRRKEAEIWLDEYHARAATMWSQLRTEVKTGESASVFIYEHGRRLFVMGTSGFPSALYHPNGFQPVEAVQKMLDQNEAFIEISESRLPEYAGDRLFMLLPVNPVSRQAAEDLMNDPTWLNLPAVKNGYVYILSAREWNYGDALIREKALDLLPELLLTNPCV